MADFEDLLQPTNLDQNIAGTAQGHFFAKYVDFYRLPKPPATPSTLAEIVTITADFVFYFGKKWYQMYSTLDTGRVSDKMVGEDDGKSFESSFEWTFPGTEAEALGLVSLFKNYRMIFIAREGNGKMRLIGSDLFPARLTIAEVDTGLKTSERKGIKLKVESRGPTPAPIVSDDVVISLTPSPIDPTGGGGGGGS
jgi:hypothetical protein